MAKHNKIDMTKFEQDAYREINKGNNTCNLIAQALKMSHTSAKFRLNTMVSEGKVMCKVISGVGYYSRGEYRAHDPFFLCPQPKGDLNGHTRQSDASLS